MSGNNVDSGIRANDAAAPDVRETPADAKSSDAMLFREYLSGGTRTNDAAEQTSSVSSSSVSSSSRGSGDEDFIDLVQLRRWQSENLVRDFIDSGQAEFPGTASAEDRYNAYMFSDTIRYNFETDTVQVLTEGVHGVGWQNVSDVSQEVFLEVDAEIRGLIAQRLEIAGAIEANFATPDAAAAATNLGNTLASNNGQQSDTGGTSSTAVDTQAPLGSEASSTEGNLASNDGTTSTNGAVIAVGGATVNEQHGTIESHGVDENGNEIFVVSDPSSGVSVVIDSNTGDTLALVHVDPVDGTQMAVDPTTGQPIEDNSFIDTFESSTAVTIGGEPADSVRVTLPDGTVLYETHISAENLEGDVLLDSLQMQVTGPNGEPLLENVPVPYAPYVPIVPSSEQTPPPDNSEGNPDTGSGGIRPVDNTTDAAHEQQNQQVDLPVDHTTDGAWEQVNQQTSQETTQTQTQNQTRGSGSGSGSGGGASPASAGSMGTGVSPTGSDVEGTPF